MRRERHVVEAACAQTGRALEFAAPSFRKDPDLVRRCVTDQPSVFRWASDHLRADRALALLACTGRGQNLRWCSEELQDSDTVLRDSFFARNLLL